MPSYFHGWSPDGNWLAFVGERGGNFDIYRVSAGGGKEERLTTSPGFDDGPDYSPDGKWIYINTDRSGGWDIYRFPADGASANDSKAERVTGDAGEDWFPHPHRMASGWHSSLFRMELKATTSKPRSSCG